MFCCYNQPVLVFQRAFHETLSSLFELCVVQSTDSDPRLATEADSADAPAAADAESTADTFSHVGKEFVNPRGIRFTTAVSSHELEGLHTCQFLSQQ